MKKEKVYHIYAKEECIYNNLSESQFNQTWETLRGMVGLMKTDYTEDDISYEVCEVNRTSTVDTSH
jgi:hypothetical protein